MRCRVAFALVGLAFALGLAMPAAADPIEGRDVLKFLQLPMVNTPLPNPQLPGGVEFFNGHDELSTAWGVRPAGGEFPPLQFNGTFMADDFADRFDSPVVHVQWWGSYLNRPTSVPPDLAQVRRFLISFESDIPATPTGDFSRPGVPLLNQIVTLDADGVFQPGEGTFTEREIWPTSVDGPIYEYNAELHLGKEFYQKANTVYWLKIVALDEIASPNVPLDQRLQWGWHNRDYTIKDALASTVADGVVPGEFQDGSLPTGGADIPIYHFQDDAVSGVVNVFIDPSMPLMPNIEQFDFAPENYEAPWDGPSLIATHSKDLAFALYTIPEPTACALVALATAMGWLADRRRN